jgi:ankyrin repeat protein
MPAHITLIDHASLSIEASTTKIVKTEDRLKVLIFLLDLDNNAGIDIQASNGKTALHFACYNGYLKIIDRLLERGADTTITCREEFDLDITCVVFNFPAQSLELAYGRHNIFPIFEK